MKIKFNYSIICFFLAFLSFTACQEEVSEIENPNEQETIVPNSVLSNLMSRTTANNGAADDILDGTSCFSVELPVTIMLNDVTIVIENQNDLEALEDVLDDFNTGNSALNFTFPITITFSDYSQIVIETGDELQSFIDQCVEEENNSIECADFVYPISFSVFNSGFSLVDTVVVQNDEALYNFLDELEDDENTIIVSLNFPVIIAYTNGETITVSTNEELAEAIDAAEQFCNDESDNCTEEEVILNLVACPWDFTDGTDAFNNYQMVFNTNGDLLIPEGSATSAIGGNWSLSTTDNGVVLTISELTAFQDTLEGDWLIVQCDDNELTFVQGNVSLELEQDCDAEENPFNCFGDFEIVECLQPNNIPVYNLSANTIGLVDCTEPFTPSFHATLMDAENNTNAIENTEAYGTLVNQVYLRIEATNGSFEVFTWYLNTTDCNYL